MPAVSIIIVTWNSAAHLPRCFAALAAQTFSDFEIVIVDNGSTDGGVEALPGRFPSLSFQVQRNETNLGFAPANNTGARLAQAPWLALLNADAFPEPDWLERLLAAAQEYPGFLSFASRQIQDRDPGRFDGEGDAYHVSGMAWRRNYNAPVAPGGTPTPVFSACAAAALYHRATFLQAGGFDEDYFSYFEDVDLGFRLLLAGIRTLYVPGAVVRHVGSASTGRRSAFAVHYGLRNLIWTFYKDMPPTLLWRYLPAHLFQVTALFTTYVLRGSGGPALRALWEAALGLPAALRKRASIQAGRSVDWRTLRAAMTRGLLEPMQEYLRR